jgi:hypothetical protein
MKTCFGPVCSLLLALALTLSITGCFREEPTLKSIVIDSPDRLEVGRTVRLRALGLYSDGKERTYGMKWNTSDEALATINDKAFLTAHAPGVVMLRAEKDGLTSDRPLQINPVFNGLKVYFKLPEAWGEPNVYIYQEFGVKTEQYCGEWPGTPMSPQGDGWYVFAVQDIPDSKVIFNDGNIQIPRPGAVGFELKKGEWWYDGTEWYETDPVIWKEAGP